MDSRDAVFEQLARESGVDVDEEVRAGANYEVATRYGDQIFVSGQIPRVRGVIVGTGRVGDTATLEQGRAAARVSILRVLSILRRSLGSLARVKKVLRVTVFVQSASDFTQQSEVADAASDILYRVFAPDGGHARTSVGVCQLPKNAAVEIDLVAAIDPDAAPGQSNSVSIL